MKKSIFFPLFLVLFFFLFLTLANADLYVPKPKDSPAKEVLKFILLEENTEILANSTAITQDYGLFLDEDGNVLSQSGAITQDYGFVPKTGDGPKVNVYVCERADEKTFVCGQAGGEN